MKKKVLIGALIAAVAGVIVGLLANKGKVFSVSDYINPIKGNGCD